MTSSRGVVPRVDESVLLGESNVIRRLRRGRGDERGAALVEMALVLPFLLILVVGIWTTARAYNVKNTMDHAVREAARYGATIDPWESGSPNDLRAIVNSELAAAAIDTGNVVSVCIELLTAGADSCDAEHTNDTATDQVLVKVSYPNYGLDFVFFSMDVNLESSAVARYES
jgi:Flp pilus assembly protein TadG